MSLTSGQTAEALRELRARLDWILDELDDERLGFAPGVQFPKCDVCGAFLAVIAEGGENENEFVITQVENCWLCDDGGDAE